MPHHIMILKRLIRQLPHGTCLHPLYCLQPLLHIRPKTLGVNWLIVEDLLPLLALSPNDLCVSVLEEKREDALEDLLEMVLHFEGFLGVSQDLKQVFVGEEVETREEETLLLEIVVETFLDAVQDLGSLLEFV